MVDSSNAAEVGWVKPTSAFGAQSQYLTFEVVASSQAESKQHRRSSCREGGPCGCVGHNQEIALGW